MKKSNQVLEQHDIQKLNDYQHARIRSEMYLGSRTLHQQNILQFTSTGYILKEEEWTPAILTAFREIIDNALDEFKKGKITNPVLKVDYNEELFEFTISDNGRGIPIDYVHEYDVHVCTMVLTETKAGRNFDDTKRDGIAGTNGLGGSITMCVSEYAHVEIVRAGKPNKTSKANEYDGNYKFTQTFEEGSILFPELNIHEPVIRKVKTENTGTTIRFKLSKEVFKGDIKLPTSLIESLLREIAATNPNYKIVLNGERLPFKRSTVKTLFDDTPHHQLHIESTGMTSDFYIVTPPQNENDEPFDMVLYGIVNNVPVYNGGTHLDTFKRSFSNNLIKALERESKKRSLTPNRMDIEKNLIIYNVTTLNAPNFDSQSKTRLINDEVIKPISSALDAEFFNQLIKKNKDWIDEIYRRCEERTHKKEADDDKKIARKLSKTKVAKLTDATGRNRSECILLIAEGDSAVSNMGAARNPEYHGILPLRGKIDNVSKIDTIAKLVKQDSIKDIMAAINLIPGQKAIRSELLYGKIYIATDADLDGYNIAALICNFLYKYWPELFEDPDNPFVYIFNTPFIILDKPKKESVYYYNYNYNEYVPEYWISKGYKATRAKGLGTLEIKHFKEAFANPVVMPIIDDGNLKETLDLIFNSTRQDDRKEWVSGD